MADENLIKQTCKELGLTYKQLGEAIGYGEGAVKNSASTGNVSEPMQHAIKMYRRILELEKELADSETIKENLKKWLR
ncbi:MULTISPECIES: transcriptional regulator [unclassified Campylobacter]|uniref:transcriptional regulator n=1 Tax=unclassified Campylobacter TaxID=2593542 RepID=UPI003D33A706